MGHSHRKEFAASPRIAPVIPLQILDAQRRLSGQLLKAHFRRLPAICLTVDGDLLSNPI